jgi:AcrR family transcriptional regulator
VKRLVDAVALGATNELACYYAGISHETFYQWLRNKPDFFEAIKEAEARGAVSRLAKIEKAASDGNWQAAAWLLERRYPQWYGRMVLDVRNVDLSKLSDEELRKLAEGKG